jgi:quercetin dioxygenase-like cupin family protein
VSARFELDHAGLAAEPRFSGLAAELDNLGPIDSKDSFNRYCREACRLWSEAFPEGIGATSGHFTELVQRLDNGGEDIIQTPWGGVVLEHHEHPQVEKYLVVRKGGYLALETHTEKVENLKVAEGTGLILTQERPGEPLAVRPLAPGDKFHFEPGQVHCLIGTEDLLTFECSTDPKGMDQDLVFIYEPD